MNMFVKCIMLLFGEILYINDTAAIAPLKITDDNEENYITDKAKLPSNFMILGKWIMISGGSWVFNKKEKGSSNVYAQFCLKSQVPTQEIINQVSFEFTRIGEAKIYCLVWATKLSLAAKGLVFPALVLGYKSFNCSMYQVPVPTLIEKFV